MTGALSHSAAVKGEGSSQKLEVGSVISKIVDINIMFWVEV